MTNILDKLLVNVDKTTLLFATRRNKRREGLRRIKEARERIGGFK